MIRISEAVLNGHPDKFCDLVADRIVEEAYLIDPDAYAQVEVATWSDRIWLSGGISTRSLFKTDVRELIVEVGKRIGYANGNHIDVTRYQIDDHICRLEADPRQWSEHVNDQSIVIGWAGYDGRTRYLSPEHFLVHALREALVESVAGGLLKGEGPDGKLLVRLFEEDNRWRLEHVLVTLQQREETELLELGSTLNKVLSEAYRMIQGADPRWTAEWKEVELLVSPNGPLVNGGSDGDNGQTGRKLAVDYYGPRVPIGGGALSGKDLAHIDRAGAYAARQAAVEVVVKGAKECTVTVAYAPNRNKPLDVRYDITGSVRPPGKERFNHDRIRPAWKGFHQTAPLGQGIHFYDPDLPWNKVN